uniref:Protein kinase domain-containing protein n=1 Tax=Amphimedon queenslandica TaxID=400682 RepID=A0A1X7TMD3_AMPQE
MPLAMASKNQLNERAGHCTVSVGDSLYVWGGAQAGLPKVHDSEEKIRFTSNIQHFTPSTGQWITRATTGTPPLGVIQYCCTAINDLLYYFGGWCGHDSCYHNSITQLDTVSLQWRELEPTRPVMKRGYGGMISFEHDGVHHLLMIGGMGSKPAVQLPHYKYIKLPNGRWRTNEHSIYNISSRKWSNPSIIGQCIPPASGFIIEKIDNTRAVLFGGTETDDDSEDTVTNNIYILEISISTVFWQCIRKPEAIDQWPVVRCNHAGAIIITGSDCPMLVISGGKDDDDDTLDDCWIFNLTQHSWIKLDVPRSVRKRYGHSLSVFIMSPHCVWIITVGGATNDSIAMLTELVLDSNEGCLVCDTYDSKLMTSEGYKKKYQQQLQTGRRIWLEEYQKPRKGDTADIEQTVQALRKSLEEKERKLQEKEREAQIYHQKLEQKEREEAEKDQEIRRYRHQLQEKDRKNQEALRQKDIVILEKDRELRQSQEAGRRYQQPTELTDDHWSIDKDEVTLTKEELGRGSYAVVTIGIFRGLRVAVKSLHTIIISDYNLGIFSREMSIASRVRHPNLVQFIGATKVGNPLILTELMSTSLNHEIRRNRLANQQILSIGQDVALGLNYLHLFKPQPIIHRD